MWTASALQLNVSNNDMYLVQEAIVRSGSLAPNEVIRALNTMDLLTMYGRIRFNYMNQNIGRTTLTLQWQGCAHQVAS